MARVSARRLGELIEVKDEGFTPGARVLISINRNMYRYTRANEEGRFEAKFYHPEGATVVAEDFEGCGLRDSSARPASPRGRGDGIGCFARFLYSSDSAAGGDGAW